MPRDIPIGNGELLIAFDQKYSVRDIFYPRIGMPNHTDGHAQRLGVWADGAFAWVDGDGWTREIRYQPDTMVTEVRLVHAGMGIELVCHDCVDYSSPVFFRSIAAIDLRGAPRDVRLFFHHDLSINGSALGDTACYDPNTAGLLHYKEDVYFLINACDERKCGIDHWATGVKRLGGAEGTWRDAEDGQLSRNAIAQGSVDSTVGFNLQLEPNGSSYVHYWLAAGPDYKSVKRLNRKIWSLTPQRMMERTEAYWRLWACKEPVDFTPLPEPVRDMFVRSQLILRTQIDNNGAIIASTDSEIARVAADHYSYVWPRDGALVAHALVLSGHGELSRAFFRFCARTITSEGYFLHKYNPSGTPASSWHPWTLNGHAVLPIQQDETALVLWALRAHFSVFRDVEFVKPLYHPLVVNAARWLLEHRDRFGLPQPSWDLWEERRGIHTFTVAATIGALSAAAAFSRDFGALDHAAEFLEGAERMRGAMMRHLWVEDQQRFARMATPLDDGTYRLDMTHDSANFALFAFGALPADHPAVLAEMSALRERLTVQTEIGGVARYERDYYHQVETNDTKRVPGNPWVICTLWQALHQIEAASNLVELERALDAFEWVRQRSTNSGVLAEQFHPYSGAAVSVSPLTWSHATVMTVVMRYLLRHAELTGKRSGAVAELVTPDFDNQPR